jgi:glutamine synthetase
VSQPKNGASAEEEVFARAEKEQVRFVSLQFTDILGGLKNVTIPFHKLRNAVDHGLWFDGSAIEGFARTAESDMYLEPDLSTFAIIPWERGPNTTARIVCNVYTPDGEEFPGDPRLVLRRNAAQLTDMGHLYQVSPELEFFLLKLPPNRLLKDVQVQDRASYFDATEDELAGIRNEAVTALEEMGIPVEASHHEVAFSQHEIDFHYDEVLRTADNMIAVKMVLKAIAQRHGLCATFMPKPLGGMPGSGLHIHQSLADVATGRNLFHDPEDEYEISRIARHFVAGQLAHARGMCAILAPLVNSYKRLVPGYEAPAYISWARINRSALVRVPRINSRRPESTRIELRCPDPSCNPYLAFAVMLAAGLDGIRRELPLPNAVEEDLFQMSEHLLEREGIGPLPTSLGEALTELEKDPVILAALGEHVADWFIEAKRREWGDYRLQVTQWELDRYIEVA